MAEPSVGWYVQPQPILDLSEPGYSAVGRACPVKGKIGRDGHNKKSSNDESQHGGAHLGGGGGCQCGRQSHPTESIEPYLDSGLNT